MLVKSEWAEATRGRNGGLRLGRPATDLRLGGLIQKLEGHENLIDCEKAACSLDGRCQLEGLLATGLTHFFQYMNRFTLAYLVKKPTGDALIEMHRRWLA